MRRPAGTPRAKLRSVLALLALCAFALSPVEYRGGADRVHGHSAFQLWSDVADGALDHHGHGHATTEAETAPSGPVGTIPAAGAPPDTPRLSAVATAERVTPILAVAVASALLAIGSNPSRPVWPVSVGWSGLSFRPEPPPPRQMAAA